MNILYNIYIYINYILIICIYIIYLFPDFHSFQLISCVKGKLVEVNKELQTTPELLNDKVNKSLSVI